MATVGTTSPFAGFITYLLATEMRSGTRDITHVYYGNDLIWEKGARNVAPWGTLAELSAGIPGSDPRWWSPSILQNLVSDWLADTGPSRIKNRPQTIGEIIETIVEIEEEDYIYIADNSDSNRLKRITAGNFLPALFDNQIAIRVAGVECTVEYDTRTKTLTVDNSALAGEVRTHHPAGQV